MLAEPLYVGYRTSHPNKEIVKKVKQKLKENKKDIFELVEWPVHHCQVPPTSTEEGSSERATNKGSTEGDNVKE
jgi:hypothetical protein